jgi:hypothetical protein
MGAYKKSTPRLIKSYFASSTAVGAPAQRAPMTIASYICWVSYRAEERGRHYEILRSPAEGALMREGENCVGRRGSSQPVAQGEGRRAGAVLAPCFREDVGEVPRDGLLAQDERLGDLAVSTALVIHEQ